MHVPRPAARSDTTINSPISPARAYKLSTFPPCLSACLPPTLLLLLPLPPPPPPLRDPA